MSDKYVVIEFLNLQGCIVSGEQCQIALKWLSRFFKRRNVGLNSTPTIPTADSDIF